MSQKTKHMISLDAAENVAAGSSENKVCYWIKGWHTAKSKTLSQSIISEFPVGVKPVPYTEGTQTVKFKGPYQTREDALAAMN